MTNKINSVLYTGVTSNLDKRIFEHKGKKYKKSFTSHYNCNKLIWYDITNSIETAIAYEKRIKNWKRSWKIELIEKKNPRWLDLSN